MSKHIATIKILQKQAGLGDSQYRALLSRVAGVTSSKDLDAKGAKAVMAALRRMAPAAPKAPTEGKIWALWYDIRQYLPEPERKAAYLFGIAGRVLGREVGEFSSLAVKDRMKIIEALKSRLAQERWRRSPLNPSREDVPME